MRTWGRVTNADGSKSWVEITTDANGHNDYVWLTTLCQTLLLNLGESPFHSNYGIPAQPSVIQQIIHNYYVSVTQQQFAQYFSSLQISLTNTLPPTYQVDVTTTQGVTYQEYLPLPF